MLIHNITPRTTQTTRLNWSDLLVPPVNLTVHALETVDHMLLSGLNVGMHRAAKQALIRNNNESKHIPHTMVGKLRAHLVVNQVNMATGNVLTPNTLQNFNITPSFVYILTPLSAHATENRFKLTQPRGSDLSEVDIYYGVLILPPTEHMLQLESLLATKVTPERSQ